jgi:glycosyltransferase involved in cell wall biosynthesis
MNIGIDASNIRAGGGITHLREILLHLEPEKFGIQGVILWAGIDTLGLLPNRPWLTKHHQTLLDRSLMHRFFWQLFSLSRLARKRCDLLFVPGGTYLGGFQPYIAMSQNMLPFHNREMRRYGFSAQFFRLLWLRLSQIITFIRSEGIVFLHEYADKKINEYIDLSQKKIRIIPHGIDIRFFKEPVPQYSIANYSFTDPINLLYISHIEQYKHQWNVIQAVSKLRNQGLPIKLTLVGRLGNAARKFYQSIEEFDPSHDFVQYLGEMDYLKLEEKYHSSDIFIYASSCENLPNILLEAMASGLPIACSRFEPMPDVLRDGGVYFDPEEPDGIVNALLELINDPVKREKMAWKSFELAKNYSWQSCTESTFSFMVNI